MVEVRGSPAAVAESGDGHDSGRLRLEHFGQIRVRGLRVAAGHGDEILLRFDSRLEQLPHFGHVTTLKIYLSSFFQETKIFKDITRGNIKKIRDDIICKNRLALACLTPLGNKYLGLKATS